VSKALLDKAVKAAQLYQGSMGTTIRVQQKLYGRMQKAISAVAKKYDAPEISVFDQVTERARMLPMVHPTPGKDY